MENLLNDVLQAAGGLELWKKYNILTAQIKISGIKTGIGMDSELLDNLTFQADLQGQSAQLRNFPHNGLCNIITSDAIKVYDQNDDQVTTFNTEKEKLYDPSLESPWDAMQLMYFIKYVIWQSLRHPFNLSSGEYQCEESQTFHDNKQLYRTMLVERQDYTPYGRIMSLFFDNTNLLERTDYETHDDQPILFTKISSRYALLNGLIMPTLFQIYYRHQDGTYNMLDPVVSLEVKSMKFI